MRSTALRRLGVTLAVSALALATGCGGGEEDSGSSGGEGSGSEESSITVTQADVEEHLTPPEDLPVDTPLPEPAPTGLDIIFVGHEFSQSTDQLRGLTEAAEVLDWTVEDLTYDLTNPASLTTSVQSAIEQQPDAVVIVGAVQEQYAAFLPDAQAAGIPLIGAYTPGEAQEGMYPIARPEVQYPYLAGLLAEVMAADAAETGETPNVVQLWTPAAEVFHNPINQGVEERLAEVCPDCTHELLGIEIPDMTSGAYTGQVVSYLQSHPDVKYIVANAGQLSSGLPAALAAAGLDDVTIYGIPANDVQIEELAAGAEGAWVVQSFSLVGWIVADQIARVVTGDATELWDDEHLGYVVNSDNAGEVEDPVDPLIVADYQEEFAALWGV